MLVQFCKPEYSEQIEDFDYDKYKVLSAREVETYDKFIEFIKSMLHKHVVIEGDWFEIEDFAFVFPQDHGYVPCLRVFVLDAF